ncbi:MAG: signal peptidase II [Candidatus Gracilibacteria bacterium]
MFNLKEIHGARSAYGRNKNFVHGGKILLKIGVSGGFLVILDQFLKWTAQMYWQKPFFLLPGISLRYEQNTGIAWSIPLPYTILIILNLVLIVILPFFIANYFNLRLPKAQIIMSMIMAGAFGNIIDRLFRGYVIDYISVGSFPVFNLADSLLTISIFLILVFYDRIKRVEQTKGAQSRHGGAQIKHRVAIPNKNQLWKHHKTKQR